MSIITYEDVKKFNNENRELLMKEESVNQLLLFNIRVKMDRKSKDDFIFGRVQDEKGNIKLIFFNAIPFNLLIYPISIDKDSIKELSQYLINNNISIRGINSTSQVCNEFIKDYEYRTSRKFEKNLSMDIMELRKLIPLKLPQGYFRLAKEDDFDELYQYNLMFFKEATNDVIVEEERKQKLRDKINSKAMYVFENTDHRIVSMAAMTRQLEHGVCVSFVYTIESERGQGYGKAVVYNLSKKYLEEGNEFCTLFVDKTNPISNRIYKEMGYIILKDNYDYRILNK